MNITFLIGNGFDVGLGLKSKFKDFFPIYKKLSENKPERIRMLSRNIEGDYENWSDFENALGEYTLKFDVDTKQDFIKQVKDFEKEFVDYLKWQESLVSLKNNDKIVKILIEALTNYYSTKNLTPESNLTLKGIYSNNSGQEHRYNFINFNYTYLLEKTLELIPENKINSRKSGTVELVDKIGEIVHVHGYLDKHPIIGLNDESQILNEELAADDKFCRYIVKPTINSLIRQRFDSNTTEIINKSTILCIYGMSLGVTDKKWWNLILSWLNSSSARQLVIFDYDEKYTPSTHFDLIEKEDDIIEKLETYCLNGSINVNHLRRRIHIAIHKNIFKMELPKVNDNEYDTIYDKIIAIHDAKKYSIGE